MHWKMPDGREVHQADHHADVEWYKSMINTSYNVAFAFFSFSSALYVVPVSANSKEE